MFLFLQKSVSVARGKMVFCLEVSTPAFQITDVAGPSVNEGYRTHLGAQGNTDSELRLKSMLPFYIVISM